MFRAQGKDIPLLLSCLSRRPPGPATLHQTQQSVFGSEQVEAPSCRRSAKSKSGLHVAGVDKGAPAGLYTSAVSPLPGGTRATSRRQEPSGAATSFIPNLRPKPVPLRRVGEGQRPASIKTGYSSRRFPRAVCACPSAHPSEGGSTGSFARPASRCETAKGQSRPPGRRVWGGHQLPPQHLGSSGGCTEAEAPLRSPPSQSPRGLGMVDALSPGLASY